MLKRDIQRFLRPAVPLQSEYPEPNSTNPTPDYIISVFDIRNNALGGLNRIWDRWNKRFSLETCLCVFICQEIFYRIGLDRNHGLLR